MDELLNLLERYSPGYRGRVQGAGFWQLDALEERFGRPLPGFYRRFAEVMGVDAGPLLADVKSYNPDHIKFLYDVAPWMPPQRFLYIFGDPSVDAQHYFLDLEAAQDGDGDDYEVVRFPFGEETWKTQRTHRFVSLREMLFMQAMTQVHLPTFPHRDEFIPRVRDDAPAGAPSATDAAALFGRLGFVKLHYPVRCLLFERRDAAVGLYRRPDSEAFSFQVGMRDEGELRRFEAIVKDHVDIARL